MGVYVDNPDVAQARRLAIEYAFMPPAKVKLEQFDLIDGSRLQRLSRKLDHSCLRISFDPDIV